MLIDNVLNKAADAIVGASEVSGDALNALKRLVADGYLMLIVFAEFNRRKESLAVIVKVALALLGGGTSRFGLSGFALFSHSLIVGED